MKTDAALHQFLHHLRTERGLSRNTLLAYGSDLRACFEYLEENPLQPMHLREISALHVKDFIAHLRDDEAQSPRSISRAMSSLRRFFEWCRKQGWIDASPAEGLRNPKVPKKLPVYLVDEEISRLLKAPDRADEEGFRDYAILVTFLFTGMRLSELTGLNLPDIDLQGGVIRVRGKGSKERVIPPHRLVAEAIAAYINGHRLPCEDPEQPLFLSRKGERMTSRMAGWAVKRAVERAGLNPRITPHKLRHTFATQLLHKGANLMEIKELLGHSNLSTTSIYTHTNVERLRHAVGKIKV